MLAAAAPALAAPAAMGQAPEPELSVYFTLASDSVQRGLSQADSDPAIQGGLDYAHSSGAFAGFAAATVDYAVDARLAGSRDTAVDYYAGYTRRSGDWTWNAALAHYAYPDTRRDYDYNELNFSVAFRQRWSYNVAATDDLLSFGYSAVDHEFGVSWPLPARVELGAAVGRVDSDRLAGGGYEYWNIGASRIVRRFAVDLRYYDTAGAGAVSGYLGTPADGRWVLSASYGVSLAGRGAR